MLDAVAAHYAHIEDPAHPPEAMPPRTQLKDFEVFLTLVNCRAVTPTAPAAITFMPCNKQHRSYSISLYAADPLFSAFSYIGGRQVQAPELAAAAAAGASAAAAASSKVQKTPGNKQQQQQQQALVVRGEVSVDASQRVRCRAWLQSGEELPVTAVFDKDAGQRKQRQARVSQLSPAAVRLLRQLNYVGEPATQLEPAAAAAATGTVMRPAGAAAAMPTAAATPPARFGKAGTAEEAVAAAASDGSGRGRAAGGGAGFGQQQQQQVRQQAAQLRRLLQALQLLQLQQAEHHHLA
jgi:hypothetical protein